MMSIRRTAVIGLCTAMALACALPGTAASAAAPSADVQQKVLSWDSAAARIGLAGSLWEPEKTAGRSRTGRLVVIAGNLALASGAVVAGDTSASVRYGSSRRGFRISEKWASTGWAAAPILSTSMAKVRTVSVPLGLPAAKVLVIADVFANCFPQSSTRRPRPVPARFRCTRADVLRTGGVLMMTARPASGVSSPGETTVVVQSTGLTFDQLVSIARSLQQVAGSAADGAGSAQMIGMCRQMVEGRMSPAQADAFATAYGYTTRVGSVDGGGQAVTADYRPDRFTLSTVADAVTSCTYG